MQNKILNFLEHLVNNIQTYDDSMQSTLSDKGIISPIQKYQKILMAHDGTEMSDMALRHASYLSKISGAELVILNVIDSDVMPPSVLLTFIKPDRSENQAKEDLKNTMEGGVRQMLEERVKACKELGVTNVSPLVRYGKPVEEIITAADENCDLIIMASSRITSSIRSLGSIARRVLDSTGKPVLIVHE